MIVRFPAGYSPNTFELRGILEDACPRNGTRRTSEVKMPESRQAKQEIVRETFSARLLQIQDEERAAVIAPRIAYDSGGKCLPAVSMNMLNVTTAAEALRVEAAKSWKIIPACWKQLSIEIRTISHLLQPRSGRGRTGICLFRSGNK